jgi:hypothetical protein
MYINKSKEIMQNNIYKYFLCLMIGIIIGCFVYYCFSKNSPRIIDNKIVFRDTLFEVKQSEPIIITKYKTKVEYQSDTIIETKPFIAFIDTVIVKDTVRASFDFPEKTFSLKINPSQDTVLKERLYINSLIKTDEVWWHKPALCILSLCGGYLLGRVTK